jgi:hypothetical protein
VIDAYVSVVQLIFLGVLCSGLHWIVARSEIMRPLWSRASGALGMLLACAGCSGFWLGLLLGAVGLRPLRFGIDVLAFGHFVDTMVTGVLGTFVTPVFEGMLLWGLERSAIRALGDDGEAGPGE